MNSFEQFLSQKTLKENTDSMSPSILRLVEFLNDRKNQEILIKALSDNPTLTEKFRMALSVASQQIESPGELENSLARYNKYRSEKPWHGLE